MTFCAQAAANAVLKKLRRARKPLSGETLVDYCKSKGFTPDDDRSFGAVFASLSRRGCIRHAGIVTREKGHGSPGARLWTLAA